MSDYKSTLTIRVLGYLKERRGVWQRTQDIAYGVGYTRADGGVGKWTEPVRERLYHLLVVHEAIEHRACHNGHLWRAPTGREKPSAAS